MKNTQRNYGIDLLRVVSMFMIVMLHSLGHGGVLNAAVPMSLNYMTAWLLEGAAFCAVNCFALVSGFVGLRSRFRLANIAALWLQVVFYNVIFTLVWAVLDGRSIDLPLIANALMPVKNNAYWYYTAYFGISFLVPLVNAAVEHLDRRTLILCAAGLVLVFSVYPTLAQTDIFQVKNGYHAMWLLLMYFLGACIRKLEPLPKCNKWILAAVYCGAVLLSVGIQAIGPKMLRYHSPTVLLCAVALVLLFSRLEPGDMARKVITLVSPLTFGVYLIHDSLFIRETFVKGRLVAAAVSALPLMALQVIAFAAAVFAVCLAVEYARSKLFRILRVKEWLDRAEKAIFKN